MLKGLPRGLLLAVPLIQRVAPGLRLELRPSPDDLIGWRIAERGDHHVRIEAASWFLTGHVIVHVAEGQLSFATFFATTATRGARRPPVSLIYRQVGGPPWCAARRGLSKQARRQMEAAQR